MNDETIIINITVKGDGAVKKVMHRTGTDRNGLFL